MMFSDSFMSVLPPAIDRTQPNPDIQAPTGNHYQMPGVAIQHPGLAKVAVPAIEEPSMLQNGLAGAAQASKDHPMAAPQVDPYQQVQFVQPQMQNYAPQYQNLSHLLNGG